MHKQRMRAVDLRLEVCDDEPNVYIRTVIAISHTSDLTALTLCLFIILFYFINNGSIVEIFLHARRGTNVVATLYRL